jgi:hypothetical protein
MISDHVHISKVVSLSLTADDWALYHIDDREQTANNLNQAVSVALNNFYPAEARKKIQEALDKYSKWGAADTEGHDTVQRIWDLFYK